VIHHGVDASMIPVGRGDGGYICFLGRMSPDKGVSTAIDVAVAAGIPLRIAAKMHETAEIDYFRQAVEPRLGPGVEYLGELRAEEKFALLGGALAMLNPIAWDEPFGMVMIESLATGTPVLTTGRGAAREIVVDGITGFIRASRRGLVAALALVGGLDRRACRRATEEHFSARRMAQDYAEVYQARLATAA
jgi:glycosyltransferase involved in cell wall biosynthesis